jgi:hypothetical protein
MPTFLRSSKASTPAAANSTHAGTGKLLRSTRRRNRSHSAFVTFVLLSSFVMGTGARAASHDLLSATDGTAAAAVIRSLRQANKKRILMLRRNEVPDGARFTLMSDSPLDDYKSFAEGERICVMIPQAAFVRTRSDTGGRGFAEMRIEQRDDDVMFSFRLEQGATVAVNQNFNRLDVIFNTNERANSKGLR